MPSVINVAPAVHAATIFLIQPLFLLGTYSNKTLLTLQAFLQAALSTSSHSVLSLSPTTLPPLPVYLACLKTNVSWTEWIRVLRGLAFDIVVELEQVSIVRKDAAETGVLWRAPAAAEIPFASNPRLAERKSPYAAAIQATSAVLEIDSDTDTESEASESNDSRPSSRSSNHSRFSFSSRSSASSQSSVCSIADIPKPKITLSVTTATPPIKYLYQGGISTVLTGGVMLGAKPTASRPVPALATSNNPTTPPPVYIPPHRAQRQSTFSRTQKRGAHAQTWRRGGASHTVA